MGINKKNLRGDKLKTALNTIADEDWLKVALKARNWAEYFTHSQRKAHPYCAHELDAEVLLNDAITRMFECGDNENIGRSWDGKSLNSLYSTLCGAVRSIASEKIEKEAKRPRVNEKFSSDYPSYSDNADKVDYSLIYKDIIELVREDEEVVEILEAIFKDPLSKPADIAVATGLDIESVYNAKKRLKKRVKKHLGGVYTSKKYKKSL